MGKSSHTFELPKTWTKDYTISLSYSGSMDGSSTLITFTYNSCVYIRNSGMNPKKEDTFKLTTNDRTEILKKMHELKVNRIKSEMSKHIINDGWSSSLCFGSDCISGGPSVEMNDHDEEVYSQAYDFLEAFVLRKVKN